MKGAHFLKNYFHFIIPLSTVPVFPLTVFVSIPLHKVLPRCRPLLNSHLAFYTQEFAIVGSSFPPSLLTFPQDAFCLMCMDTWFGDVNMVTDIGDNGAFLDWNPSPRTWLHRDPAGHPRIFNRFCANLMTKGLLDFVLPFR